MCCGGCRIWLTTETNNACSLEMEAACSRRVTGEKPENEEAVLGGEHLYLCKYDVYH